MMSVQDRPLWQQFLEDIVPKNWSLEQKIARARACQIEMPVRAILGQIHPEREMEYAARNALYWMTMDRVIPAFDKIHFLVLKGPALAIRIFGSECYRQSADIDLWMDKSDLKRAEGILKDLGYTPQKVVRRWATNQILYISNNPLMLPIELHWALTQPPLRAPKFKDAWKRRVVFTYNQIQFYTLDDTDTWTGLIFHAIQHVYALKPWLDLAAASSVLHLDENRIHQFGVYDLHTCINNVIRSEDVVLNGDMPGENTHRIKDQYHIIIRWILKRVFISNEVGKLIINKDSSYRTAFTFLSRTASMLLLDGYLYPLKSMAFYIPLSIDIICRKLLTRCGILHISAQ